MSEGYVCPSAIIFGVRGGEDNDQSHSRGIILTFTWWNGKTLENLRWQRGSNPGDPPLLIWSPQRYRLCHGGWVIMKKKNENLGKKKSLLDCEINKAQHLFILQIQPICTELLVASSCDQGKTRRPHTMPSPRTWDSRKSLLTLSVQLS